MLMGHQLKRAVSVQKQKPKPPECTMDPRMTHSFTLLYKAANVLMDEDIAMVELLKRINTVHFSASNKTELGFFFPFLFLFSNYMSFSLFQPALLLHCLPEKISRTHYHPPLREVSYRFQV